MRSDAVRNRARILAAAHDAFAELGASAQVDDVAARAGVGVGTLYRHFPTKDALVVALVDERFALLAELAREHVAREGDPWTGFAGFVRAAYADVAGDRGMQEAFLGFDPALCEAAAERSGTTAATAVLIDRAHAAGALREDFGVQHVGMVMSALCGSLTVPGWDAELHLAILLDGLRVRAV